MMTYSRNQYSQPHCKRTVSSLQRREVIAIKITSFAEGVTDRKYQVGFTLESSSL